ncbi:MAG: GatB/YqeY domain-containing protein [Desulfovibrio sp.]|nr:GatB/YqeY domain-containing protein [Desulfovibrio sp.]
MTTTLFEQIDKDYVMAYKARESIRVSVLRLLKTAIKNRLVALKRPGGILSDEEIFDLILKECKQRQESIEQYTAAGRSDLADKERSELNIIKEYMPNLLTSEEFDVIIDETLAEVKATTRGDMGRVMSTIMTRYKGRVDGKLLSSKVKQRLL